MTRLTIAWCLVLCSLLVLTICVAVFLKIVTEGILLALGGIILTLSVKVITAIRNRNAPDETK